LSALAAALRPDAPKLLAAAGVLWTLVATLDPARPSGTFAGPLLCLLALLLQSKRLASTKGFIFVAVLTACLAAGTLARPDFRRGDFRTYFCYLRSAAFDLDLDFTNEYESWGLAVPPLTPTGHRRNVATVGLPILWSPFFAAAHVYVLFTGWLGASGYAADGNSAPYVRAALAGTITAAVAGAWLLVTVLRRRLSLPIAVVAAVAAVTTSPLLIYVFAEPGMAHGVVFGLACVGVWLLDRLRRQPTLEGWALLGVLMGGLMLVRLQAAAFGLAALPVAIEGITRRTVRPIWLVISAAAAALVFSPQLVVWKILYGRVFTAGADLKEWSAEQGIRADALFQPGRYLDPSSPRLFDVLFSADHGLFAWTPAVLLGLLFLIGGLRRWGLLGFGGLLVFAATAWFNGSYATSWRAGDAFGARRFDVIFPFVAMGFGSLLTFLVRLPLLAPTLLIGAFTVWNIGFATLWRHGAVGDAAGLEKVAALQAHQLRRLSERFLTSIAGAPGRSLAYNYFVGTFFFTNSVHDGLIDLGSQDLPFLTGGWSQPINEVGLPSFRLAYHPRSCVRIPLLRPVALEARVTARAPAKLGTQVTKVTLNGLVLAQVELDTEWGERSVPLPSSALVSGENLLCLEFDRALPGPEGQRVAARVKRIVVH
jgi:hypothetical protein